MSILLYGKVGFVTSSKDQRNSMMSFREKLEKDNKQTAGNLLDQPPKSVYLKKIMHARKTQTPKAIDLNFRVFQPFSDLAITTIKPILTRNG